MSSTTFVDGTTVVNAVWLNDVNKAVYTAIGNGTQVPSTATDVKTNLGLNLIDNTSDVNKPISSATQTALNLKSNISTTIEKDSSTGAGHLPAGTTAQRSGTPVIGDTRFNTTLDSLEVWNGSAWVINFNSNTYAGNRNKLVNGCCRIAQRGPVSFTSTNNLYGGADRWLTSISGTTVSAVVFQAATGFSASGYAQQVGNVVTTGATTISIQQRIESINTIALNGKTVTFSAKVYQSTGSTQTLTFGLQKATAVDNFGSVTQLSPTTMSIPNNTWTTIQITQTLGATDASNGLVVFMSYGSLSAQATTQFYFGEMQLEEGSTKTPFENRPYGLEFALCQRYYYRIWGQGGDYVQLGTGAVQSATNAARLSIPSPVLFRAAPTLNFLGCSVFDGVAVANITAVSAIHSSPNSTGFDASCGGGLTIGRPGVLFINIGTTNYVELSAEL